MAATDTLIDSLFDGRYRIVRKLGAGGMANVYLAEDQELGRRVAIKILNERHANDEQFVERFRREAKSAAGLSHPNIVSIYDRGEAEGTYYIAMEHLDGRTLKELIVSRGPAPVPIAIDYARQILGALRFAHRNGIVHRDIKPHNALVDAEGRLKVTDFGIARAGASQMTETGSIIGTAQYLSPEQARGGGAVDHRSDLYSLGVVLYELLTGTVPFSGDTPVEIAMRHLSERPELPSAQRGDVPRDLDLIVMRALAKDPDDRYQTAEEMDVDLARVARGLHVSSETEEAATAIITGAATMPTTISRAPTGVTAPATRAEEHVYYDYAEPVRPRRPIWPWLAALLLIVAAAAGGWYAYDEIQDQLNETKPVAVPDVEGIRETLARGQIRDKGLKPVVAREFNEEVPRGFVIDQDPEAGNRINRGNEVTLTVSRGKERVIVPDVRGKTIAQAVSALDDVGLDASVFEVNSTKRVNTVIAQDPKAGDKIPKGEDVRINVSKGPKPVTVPSVEGQAFESASSRLQGAGFNVVRRDVDSNVPAGIVVGQSPAGGEAVPKGAVVTLSVSKGPKTTGVPDVTSLPRADAIAVLRDAGFKAQVVQQDTDDEGLGGIVLDQSPGPGSQAERGATVTITVGRFVPAQPTDTTTDTTETVP